MKRMHYLIVVLIGLLLAIGLILYWVYGESTERVIQRSRSPQSNNSSTSQVANFTYDSTNGAEQVIVVGRGVTTPQSNNYSESQIANFTYDSTNGAKQVIVSSNSSDIPFINTTSLTDGDLLYYDETGAEWLNSQGQIGASGIGTSPKITLKNPTAEDTDEGRESTLEFRGIQSGTEESALAKIIVSHDGAGDDEKGKVQICPNDGDDGDTLVSVMEIGSLGEVSLYGASQGLTFYYGAYPGALRRGGMAATGNSFEIIGYNGAPITLQPNANFGINAFDDASSGETPALSISGYYAGDAKRTLAIGISSSQDNEAALSGTGTYSLDGGIIAKGYTSDPCSSMRAGALFYNSTANVYCFCDGTNDLKVHDNSACF